jgi:cation transport regulator ChaB
MPYRSTSDLPATVQEALPLDASELFLRVINRALKDSSDDQKAFRVAWGALRNAGWRPGEDGSWVRKGWQVSAQLEKAERRDDGLLCFGWASVAVNDAGELVIDQQGDIIEPSELESAVYKYNETHRASTDHHSRSLDAELVESIYIDTEKRVAMGLEPEGRTGWWCGFRVHDGTIAKGVEDGSIKQFSIGGSFERGEMIEGARKLHGLSVDEIAFCEQGAGLGVDLTLSKNKQEIEKMTLEEVLEGLGDEARAVIEAALAEAAKDKASEEMEAAAEEAAEEAEPTDEELMKSLPAGFAKRLEAERQERQAMAKQLAEIKETQTVERFSKSAKSLSNLPMSAADLAKTLRACGQQLDDVTHTALTGMLDRIQKALGQTFEAPGTQAASSDDRAIDRLNAAARDIATRDGLGIAKAFEAACRQHPDLYREHREDQN